MAKIVVIGAGMSAMAAAAKLAAQRHQVVVCEASDTYGGAVSTYRHGDLVFDTGPYTLTLPAAYRDLFVKTGSRKASAAARLEDRIGLFALDPVRRYVFPDGVRLDLPNSSRGRLRTALAEALGSDTADGWLHLVDHGSRVWATTRPSLVEAPGGGRELARLLAGRAGRRALTPGRTLRGLSRSWFDDPRLRLLRDDYARQAGADPRRAPGVVAARVYIEHAFGAWRVAGGMGKLAEALHDRAADRGAGFRFGSAVQLIERDRAGAVSGVELATGERIAADIVVAGVDRGELGRLLGKRSAATRSLARRETTVCLEVRESTLTARMPHETVYLRADGSTIRVHVPEDRPAAWTVHATGPLRDTAAILDALAESGLDLRTRAQTRWVIPAGDDVPRADSGLRDTLLRSPVAQPVRGLYHVGASARPGSGLAFAALSGTQAAGMIGSAAR